VGSVACKYVSVNSTICILGSAFKTAACKDFQAFWESDVSVRYVQGGENLEGLFTDEVETPFSVAETLERRPSALLLCKSPMQVTTVREGSVTVRQARRPTEVGNVLGASYGAFLAVAACTRILGVRMPARRAWRRERVASEA
jgi:hypothetical protein